MSNPGDKAKSKAKRQASSWIHRSAFLRQSDEFQALFEEGAAGFGAEGGAFE